MKQPAKTLFFLLFIIIAFATTVQTAKAIDNNDFGSWYPRPDKIGSGKYYRANLQPFSSESVAEASNFSCIGPNGMPFTQEQKEVLGKIFSDATAAYYGKLYKDGETDNEDKKWPKSAGAWKKNSTDSGSEAMRAFLNFQYGMVGADWDQFSDPNDNDEDTGKAYPGLAAFIPAPNNTSPNTNSINPRLGNRSSFDRMSGAAGPAELAMLIDQGCQISPIIARDPGGLGAMIKNPQDWFTDLLLYIPTKLTSSWYNYIEPYAFKFTFFTPHSERGDTYWNIALSCNSEEYSDTNPSASGVQLSKEDNQKIQDSCSSGEGESSTPLGFSRKHLNVNKQNSAYLVASMFLQWLISATYFLILFSAAVVYMIRGSAAANFNVLQLIPRLIISAIGTMFAPIVIGLFITISNTFVQAMFNQGDSRTIGAISDLVRQSGAISGSPDDLISRVIQLVVGGFTAFYFTFFSIFGIVRQVALIALIVLAPLAFFCIIIPKWQHRFGQWLRGVVFVSAAPAIMAFILKLGVMLNPMLNSVNGATGLLGFISVLLLLIVLWLMSKVLKLSVSAAIGTQLPGLTGNALSGAGGILQQLGAGDGKLAAAARASGRAASMGGALAQQSDSIGARMIPQGRGLGVGGGASHGGGGGGMANPLAALGGMTGAMAGGRMGHGGAGWLESKIMERNAAAGARQISGMQAMNIKAARKQALDRQKEAMLASGRKMDRRAKKAFLDQYDAEKGGVTRRGRNWVKIDPKMNDKNRHAVAREALSRQLEEEMGKRLSRSQRKAVKRDMDIIEFKKPRHGRKIERLAAAGASTIFGKETEFRPTLLTGTNKDNIADLQTAAKENFTGVIDQRVDRRKFAEVAKESLAKDKAVIMNPMAAARESAIQRKELDYQQHQGIKVFKDALKEDIKTDLTNIGQLASDPVGKIREVRQEAGEIKRQNKEIAANLREEREKKMEAFKEARRNSTSAPDIIVDPSSTQGKYGDKPTIEPREPIIPELDPDAARERRRKNKK